MKLRHFAFIIGLSIAVFYFFTPEPTPRHLVRVEGDSTTAIISTTGRIIVAPDPDTLIDLDIVKLLSRMPDSVHAATDYREYYYPGYHISIRWTPDPGVHSIRVWKGTIPVNLNHATRVYIIKKLWIWK